MANAKISDDSVFVPETSDVRNITGLAGYTGSGNVKITGSLLAQSVVNESLSGIGTNNGGNINSRVAFYGVGNPSNTLAGAEGFQYYSANSSQSTSASLQLGVAGGNQYDVGNLILNGNYIAGNEQPKITFKFGDTTNTPKEFTITTSSSGVDQTLVLPNTLPSTGQFLKVSGVFNTDNVVLDWGAAGDIGGSGTAFKVPLFSAATTLTDSVISQTTIGGDPILTLESSDIRIKEKISHSESPSDTFIGFTADGKFEVTTDGSEAIVCGTAGEVELKQSGVAVAKTINHGLQLSGNGVVNGFAGRLRINCDQNNHYVDILGPDHASNTAVSYTMQLPNKIATQTAYGSNGRILELNAAGQGQWIDTPTSLSPGGNSQSVQYNASGIFSGDSGFTYQLQNPTGNIKNRLQIGDVGTSKGEVNIYGGATESGMISLIAPSDEGVILTVPTAPNDSYTITLPGDTPANNQILESNSSGNLSWIDTPTGVGIDFSSLNINTIKADLTQSSQTQYGSAITVTAGANISNGDIVIWDYSNGTVKAQKPGSLPAQNQIIGVAIENINSGSTGKVLIYGYATARSTYTNQLSFLNETNTLNISQASSGASVALPTTSGDFITFKETATGNSQSTSCVFDAGAGNTVKMQIVDFDFDGASTPYDRLQVLVGPTSGTITTPAALTPGITGSSGDAANNGWKVFPNFFGSSTDTNGPLASGNAFPSDPGRSTGGQTGPVAGDEFDLGQRFAQFDFKSDGSVASSFELKIASIGGIAVTNTSPGEGIYLDPTDFEKGTNNNSTNRFIGTAAGGEFANNAIVILVAPPRV